MPIIKSAIKNQRKSLKNQIRNNRFKGRMKEAIRAVKDAVEAGKKKDAATLLPKAFSYIDKGVKKNHLHKNTAARKKSALAKLVG